ncbi:MAG: antibiotic biosynthesis monooxygenase [Parvibaculum sp.]|jgi:heme-degrading monooxygenase HmoA|nr:antibiotic biosynthesis monooxygenase [Parvibaculum sp.]|tara:strand:+ start:359 stop:661 length:303 start_codon:yes stop_codon:yes gene_type:complete
MIVAIFRARIRPENADEYYALADEMGEIARALPGFISWKGYFAEDGERVSLHEWESAEALEAWRTHPEHLRIQELGREKFYEEYTLYVMDEPRSSKFVRA